MRKPPGMARRSAPNFVYTKCEGEVKSSIVSERGACAADAQVSCLRDSWPCSVVFVFFFSPQFGIKSLKRGSVRSHQDFSRKTLIALVTSGLLLAFLGLAGYFLMKRRSWSPMGERLGEDPYYMENGSQGNATVTTAPHEPPEPQEKPNLNGGAQENGTGQASSQNGRSAKQHSVADTQM
uniref:CD34 n=1 Tax=Apteryx owenii TaxID=8824 RepID=A0A8B9PMG8_APTOW